MLIGSGGGSLQITIRSIPVNYIDIGSGSPVLILQGWGTNLGLYTELAAHLSQKMRVILPELPGFGETPEPPAPFSADDYAAFTEEFLRALGIKRCSLICHSNGGRIAMKLVTHDQYEFEYDRIVFMDSAGVIPEKTARQKFRQRCYKLGKSLLSLTPVRAAFPDALEKYRSKHGSADYRAASSTMRATLVKLVNEDFRPLMPLIRQPSLLIWGTEDTATPLSDARVFENLIPNAGLVEVKGAGHYAYLEHPAFVFRVLDSFFGHLDDRD